MKKFLIPAAFLFALLAVTGAVWAEEAVPPEAETVEEAPAADSAAQVSCEDAGLEAEGVETLFEDSTRVVCSCIDQCNSDAECVFFHGEGSTCEPVGPCDCKECTVAS